ncbi:MAG TPA: ferritin-like domain-containing protein [Polyangiaceae bacterium]|jgi:hypothetical protein
MNQRQQWVPRTNLSIQLGSLRLSLLMALGLSPLACGGTALRSSDGQGGAGGGFTPQGGAPGDAGGPELGGAGVGGKVGYAGAAGSAGAAPGAGGVAFICSDPTLSPGTYLATCQNGLVHRPQAVACGSPANSAPGTGGVAGTGASGSAGAGGAMPIACSSNDDCPSFNLGWCENRAPLAGVCHAGCVQDSDCDAGGLCQCDSQTPAGRCVYGNCRVDSDCGLESVCAQVVQTCGQPTFRCSHATDECLTSADCPLGELCLAAESGRLACMSGQCGRPFLVSDAPRVAAIRSRADWLDASLTPELTALSPTQRAELAAHWARLGQMEHASIAAFARFNLQLLSLGAPAALIEACNRALADETEHTRLCFALASHYAGTQLGPDRLDIRHSFDESSLEAVIQLVLSEGCIGETVAALEAQAGAASATDPVIRGVLARIARDEQAHAELAFRFMRWALAQVLPAIREKIASDAEQRLASYERKAKSAAQASAARHVVRPLLAAIFASASFSASAPESHARCT